MHLYLMRHGQAEAGPVDELRALNERGLADVQAVAKVLTDHDVLVAQIYHSTLVRAKQTAEIIGKALNPPDGLKETRGFEPWGDVETFTDVVGDWGEDTLVCGHEPFLGDAATALLDGKPVGRPFKTATVMAFEHITGTWTLQWVLDAKTLKLERP